MAFGDAHLKQEGAPLHPDDLDCDFTDKRYEKQLQAYNQHFKCVACKKSIIDALKQITGGKKKLEELLK